jgi:hypothetical protein
MPAPEGSAISQFSAKNSPVWRRDVVDRAANPRNSFVYSIGGLGNAAMDLAIRDLNADELELVAGGDAPRGAGCATEEDTCLGWKDGPFGTFGFIFTFAC